MEVEETSTIDVCKIKCSNIPDEFLKKSIARKHFEQFGEVLHMILKPKSKLCYVHYRNHKDAQYALFNGSSYMGKKFNINLYNNVSKRKSTSEDFDPDWAPSPEIQNELDAMSALGGNRKTYNLRPEAMVIDYPVKQPIKKTTKRIWPLDKSKPKPEKNVWTSDQLELLNIIKQSANTVEEKFKVLEARDKLMRLHSKKHTDLTKTTATVGTCPDMCPEKERLMREVQHQVALYEQDTAGKGMNSYLAIKQYSRSSADQEVPLPHELRPVSVLELSMGYLMHCIMDLCDSEDVNLAEWFHFLWDRTRSIRKDITQQELCCQGSMALIEQCARFHIHCSARLVAEDPSVFDQKINTENLTKCLQTLKYMYHDLNLKGESCVNEAEFRAYIILLNLNDGNFMWEVQQLKLEIQKSSEVKFALEIYSAINTNNFVKFFKLVCSTNYLNACILLRYFIQVRSIALSIILKCYSPRMSYTQFPLFELQHLLAFEDTQSTIDFLAAYGLYLNQDETQVILDRKMHQEPEIPLSLDRAINIVELKRTKTVGEIVCGGTLPPPKFKSYVPHNSFKDNGELIINDTLADLMQEAQTQSNSTYDSLDIEQNPPKSTNVDQADGNKADPALPFWSLKTDPKLNIFKTKSDSPPPLGIFAGHKPKTDASKTFTFKQPVESQLSIFNQQQKPKFNVFGDKTVFGEQPKIEESKEQNRPSSIFKVPQFPIVPETKQDETIMQKFFANDYKQDLSSQKPISFGDSKSSSIFNAGIFKTSKIATAEQTHFSTPSISAPDVKQFEPDAEVKRIEEERQRLLLEKEAEEQRKREQERKRMETLKQKLAQDEEIRKTNERREMLRQQEENKRIAAMLAEKERLLTLEIKKSVTKLMDDLLNKVEEIHKQERLKVIATSVKNFKLRLFIQIWRQKCRVSKRKRHAIDQNPIWLPSRSLNEEAQELFTANQELTLHNIKRYKCGKSCDISIPEKNRVEKIDIDHFYKRIVGAYAKMQIRSPNEFFWKVTVSLPDFKEMKIGLNVIESVLMNYFDWKDRYGTTARIDQYKSNKPFGYCIEKKQGVLEVESNSNGLLFISHEPNDALYQRIQSSVRKFPNRTTIPVAVVFINNNKSCVNSQRLGKMLEKNPHISNYEVTVCTFTDTTLLNSVKQSLVFLTENIQKPPPLQLESFPPFIYSHLASDIWKRMASYSAWNAQYRDCLKLPNLVISLYNEAIDKIKEITLERSLLDYPEFPVEFDKFLLEKTPEILPCDYRYFPSFWKKATYHSLLRKAFNSLKLPQYHTHWPPNNESDLEKDIFYYCKKIFENPESVFYNIMVAILKNFNSTTEFEKIKNVSWIDIIEVVAVEKLREANTFLHHTEFHSKSIFQQLFVVYNVNTLEAFKSDEWFYLENPLIKNEIKKAAEKMKLRERKSPLKANTIDHIDLDELEKSVRSTRIDDVLQKSSEIEELEGFIADLEQSMDIHKQINASFQRTVKEALGVDK